MLPGSTFNVILLLFPGVYGAQVCVPKQADYTNKHEPEVWRNNGKVYELSGYVYSPITQ